MRKQPGSRNISKRLTLNGARRAILASGRTKPSKFGQNVMILATVLSAGATAFTGYVALRQAEFAQLSLIASDRNRAFLEFRSAYGSLCDKLPSVLIGPRGGRLSDQQNFEQLETRLSGAFRSEALALYARAQDYRVWITSKSDDEWFESAIGTVLQDFEDMDKAPIAKRFLRDWPVRWVQAFFGAQDSCWGRREAFLNWFKYGETFVVARAARPETIVGDDIDSLPTPPLDAPKDEPVSGKRKP